MKVVTSEPYNIIGSITFPYNSPEPQDIGKNCYFWQPQLPILSQLSFLASLPSIIWRESESIQVSSSKLPLKEKFHHEFEGLMMTENTSVSQGK